MNVNVRLFAAAAEAVGAHEVTLEVGTVAQLREALSAMGPDAGEQSASVIRQCAVLESGVRREDDHALAPGARVDVMPPFAGG